MLCEVETQSSPHVTSDSDATTMSWFKKTDRTLLQKFATRILKAGPIPKHLAFIMDGNRRFANKNRLASVVNGHEHGFEKLTEILSWCHDLDITEVTVYAFSIENFKRSEDEVSGLLSLAKDKFSQLLAEREKLMENGVCIRIFGRTDMLPIDLQKLLAQAVSMTRSNSKAFLNVCFAYTFRAELTSAVNDIVTACDEGLIQEADITDDLLRRCFWSSESSDPDLVIRTSGESRLSDFILWQSGYSVIAFVEKLWPEFTIWDLFKAVFFFQRHCNKVTSALKNYHIRLEQEHSRIGSEPQPRQSTFIRNLNSQRHRQIQELGTEVAAQCA